MTDYGENTVIACSIVLYLFKYIFYMLHCCSTDRKTDEQTVKDSHVCIFMSKQQLYFNVIYCIPVCCFNRYRNITFSVCARVLKKELISSYIYRTGAAELRPEI